MNKPTTTEAVRITEAFTTLARWFQFSDHIMEGELSYLGIEITSTEAVNLGWLRRVKGPARYDNDWMVPSGHLAHDVAQTRGSAVLATWANYQDRREM